MEESQVGVQEAGFRFHRLWIEGKNHMGTILQGFPASFSEPRLLRAASDPSQDAQLESPFALARELFRAIPAAPM
jgi:hypothetical protein